MRSEFKAMLLVALAGCGSSSSSSSTPSLDQTWEVFNPATGGGQGITFSSNGTYVHSLLQTLTSGGTVSSNLEGQVEQGTFTVAADGHTMTLTPVQWSCTGAYAPYMASFTFDGSTLVFSVAGTVLEMTVDTTNPSSVNNGNGVSLTEGCFTSMGFVQQAPAPVSP